MVTYRVVSGCGHVMWWSDVGRLYGHRIYSTTNHLVLYDFTYRHTYT